MSLDRFVKAQEGSYDLDNRTAGLQPFALNIAEYVASQVAVLYARMITAHSDSTMICR